MAAVFKRLMGMQTLTGAATQDSAEYFDSGGSRVLEVQTRVITAGSAGTITLEHAAVNEDNAFVAITGYTAVSLASTTNNAQSITSFLRWIRWKTGTAPTGSPTLLIDVVAKE